MFYILCVFRPLYLMIFLQIPSWLFGILTTALSCFVIFKWRARHVRGAVTDIETGTPSNSNDVEPDPSNNEPLEGPEARVSHVDDLGGEETTPDSLDVPAQEPSNGKPIGVASWDGNSDVSRTGTTSTVAPSVDTSSAAVINRTVPASIARPRPLITAKSGDTTTVVFANKMFDNTIFDNDDFDEDGDLGNCNKMKIGGNPFNEPIIGFNTNPFVVPMTAPLDSLTISEQTTPLVVLGTNTPIIQPQPVKPLPSTTSDGCSAVTETSFDEIPLNLNGLSKNEFKNKALQKAAAVVSKHNKRFQSRRNSITDSDRARSQTPPSVGVYLIKKDDISPHLAHAQTSTPVALTCTFPPQIPPRSNPSVNKLLITRDTSLCTNQSMPTVHKPTSRRPSLTMSERSQSRTPPSPVETYPPTPEKAEITPGSSELEANPGSPVLKEGMSNFVSISLKDSPPLSPRETIDFLTTTPEAPCNTPPEGRTSLMRAVKHALKYGK
jgi:hypothetical protein